MKKITALAAMLAIPALAAPAGYFQVPGTETTMKVYGKAETWAQYGFDGLNDVTGTNSYSTTVAAHNDGAGVFVPAATTVHSGYNESVLRSGVVDSFVLARVGVTTTTPSAFGDVNVKVEYQAKSTGGTNAASLNLRHAYGEFAGLLIGQTDSLFSAWHNSPNYYDSFIADFNGSGRTRQIRYTLAPAKGVQIGFSMEQDRTAGTSTQIAPQLVGAFQYGADWGNVTASVGYQKKSDWSRNIPANTTATKSGTGVSIAISGAFNLGANDSLTAMIQNGGDFYGAAIVDGFYTKPGENSYSFYKATVWNLGYSHTWTPAVASNIGIGQTMFKKDVNVIDPKATITELFLNTTYSATKNTLFGAEFLYQQAKQTDGYLKKDGTATSSNTDKRLKLFFRYSFF